MPRDIEVESIPVPVVGGGMWVAITPHTAFLVSTMIDAVRSTDVPLTEEH